MINSMQAQRKEAQACIVSESESRGTKCVVEC